MGAPAIHGRTPPAGGEALGEVPADSQCFVAIGDAKLRAFVGERLREEGRTLATLAHPSAIVSPSASVGPGCYLGENVLVRTQAQVGRGAILSAGTIVSHHCALGDYTMLGINAAVAGRAEVGSRCLVGVGSSVRPVVRIGDDVVVGVGAAVVRDAPDGCTVVGNPARPLPTNRSRKAENQSDWGARGLVSVGSQTAPC